MFIKDVSKDKPYRGIERKGILLSVLHGRGLREYTQLFDSDGFIPYSVKNVVTLRRLCKPFSQCEIILYGKDNQAILDGEQACFLGFDVSGDSQHLSVIHRIYYECQDKHFYAENYNNYLEKLNSNGLFGNYCDASSFICSIDSIINKVCLDCDGDLYPQYVYCLV